MAVTPACNPRTLGGTGRWISEFGASLVYTVSSRKAKATQRNPASKNKQNKKQKTKTTTTIKLSDNLIKPESGFACL